MRKDGLNTSDLIGMKVPSSYKKFVLIFQFKFHIQIFNTVIDFCRTNTVEPRL